MTFRPARTWIGWCVLAGVVASCSSSGGGGSSGGNGGNGGNSGLTGGSGGGAGSQSGSGGAGGAGNGTGGSAGGQAVGTSGGSVTQAGVMLDIPANALSTTTMITVATTTAPVGYTLASAAYQFGPSGTTFAQPVAVTIPLTLVTTGVHVFWSNAGGGFDDVGGIINGSSITANVSHFSTGFCAVPSSSSGAGGAQATGGGSGQGGASGTAGVSGNGGQAGSGATGGASGGAGSSGAGGSSGTAGSGGSGAGGSGTGAAGTSGSAGGPGTGGSAGPTDAGLSGDAAASLCKAVGLNLPGASLSSVDAGAAPDGSAYAGGTIVSGTYYLNSVTHYGAGSYTGARQVEYIVDATARTIRIGEYLPAGGSQYTGLTYTPIGANTLQVVVVCNTGTGPSGYNLYYNVSGTTLTLTVPGSDDVSAYRDGAGG
jgi:hypothetical protein